MSLDAKRNWEEPQGEMDMNEHEAFRNYQRAAFFSKVSNEAVFVAVFVTAIYWFFF